MEILNVKKNSGVTLDTLFDAFRGMTRNDCNKIVVKQNIYTLSSPIENMWFIHAFDFEGNQIASAKFDQFDM